jgi:hypothetical protein
MSGGTATSLRWGFSADADERSELRRSASRRRSGFAQGASGIRGNPVATRAGIDTTRMRIRQCSAAATIHACTDKSRGSTGPAESMRGIFSTASVTAYRFQRPN